MATDWDGLDRIIGVMMPLLNERERRLFIGACGRHLGRGASAHLHELTGMSRSTISKGVEEVASLPVDPTAKTAAALLKQAARAAGAGSKPLEEHHPDAVSRLLKIVNETAAGGATAPLSYTTLSSRRLAERLNEGEPEPIASHTSICRLLKEAGFRLDQTSPGSADRNAQFDYINKTVRQALADGVPVLAIEAALRKDEGAFAPAAMTDDAAPVAAAAIGEWLRTATDEPQFSELVIIASDTGSLRWQLELQKIADEKGFDIRVLNFPSGTTRWNAIEEQFVTEVRSLSPEAPQLTLQVTVSRIGPVADKEAAPSLSRPDSEKLAAVNVVADDWRGDWNYTVKPHRM